MYTPNLPVINPLRTDTSTYITFTKALSDFDRADSEGTEYYFSKMVALKLPDYKYPEFFLDLDSIGVISNNPNTLIPKLFQYYLENIFRQEVLTSTGSPVEEIAEIAFWKSLSYMAKDRVDDWDTRSTFVFENKIVISNFISDNTSSACWVDLIGQIPNKCGQLIAAFRDIDMVNSVQTFNDDVCLVDDESSKQFIFTPRDKKVIDFDNLQFNTQDEGSFEFNVLLLYYKDKFGIDKLHGINFIFPFDNKATYWEQTSLMQHTNVIRSMGYQFRFTLKTCWNEASLVKVYEEQSQTFYSLFGRVLGDLDSFLEDKMHNKNIYSERNRRK
jgi:hypothetical protein